MLVKIFVRRYGDNSEIPYNSVMGEDVQQPMRYVAMVLHELGYLSQHCVSADKEHWFYRWESKPELKPLQVRLSTLALRTILEAE